MKNVLQVYFYMNVEEFLLLEIFVKVLESLPHCMKFVME